MEKRICILYTGGTIGMVPTPRGYAPRPGYLGPLLAAMPELKGPEAPAWDLVEMDPLLDSSNIAVGEWNAIGRAIFERYDDYDGFVVLHGTDTMAYTAGALSFMLENLQKPVVLTGSQLELVAQLCEAKKAGIPYQISVKLDQLKHNFQRIPWVSRGIDQISQMLNDPDSQQKFWSAVLQRSGGLLQLSLGTLSGIAAILVDILLTIFFFSLFLRTIALNTDSRGKGQSLSSYLVRTVFNGSWLPEAKEETLAEGERIIGGVVFKLKAWLRGYIILVSIDTIVYSTVFYLLGVPYAPILGFLAGCGLLLPYIGPIASALLTILVTLAIGGDTVSGLQIAGIIGIYLFHNGIVEQFFLYPAVIGEALGLTTLETIIVVLLGAIFAGITGMIFAMPAAAVIKYLVPQFYRTVRR